MNRAFSAAPQSSRTPDSPCPTATRQPADTPCLQRPTMRHAAFNPLRHKLRQPVLARALARRQRRPLRARSIASISSLPWKYRSPEPCAIAAQRTHPAIRLERPPLIQNRLARALIHAGKQRPHHHHARARRNRLGHIARVLDAAIRNHRNPPLAGRTIRLGEIAVICGMPAPVTMRVVQIDPGPIPP
jgi:hypothetical protein